MAVVALLLAGSQASARDVWCPGDFEVDTGHHPGRNFPNWEASGFARLAVFRSKSHKTTAGPGGAQTALYCGYSYRWQGRENRVSLTRTVAGTCLPSQEPNKKRLFICP